MEAASTNVNLTFQPLSLRPMPYGAWLAQLKKKHKARAQKSKVYSKDPELETYTNKCMARSFKSNLEARDLRRVARLPNAVFKARVHYE